MTPGRKQMDFCIKNNEHPDAEASNSLSFSRVGWRRVSLVLGQTPGVETGKHHNAHIFQASQVTMEPSRAGGRSGRAVNMD